jgi:topoisomerase-4 subunit B
MNPETRTLIRVLIDDAATAEKRVTTLMGDKVEPRRKWIESNVQFGMHDLPNVLEKDHVTMQEGGTVS